MNIVNVLITALMTSALLDELFLWTRYRQLRKRGQGGSREVDRGV